MADVFPILLLGLLALPLSAAVLVAALGPRQGAVIHWLSLASTVGSLVFASILTAELASTSMRAKAAGDEPLPTTFQPRFVTKVDLLVLGPSFPAEGKEAPAIQFYVGLDGLNVWLVVLTAVLMVSSVLISWPSIKERANEYFALLLLLQAVLVGVFIAFDIICFYVFFELALVPLFFLIGIWGGPQRQYAARKFFIYTLAGSLITLLGVLGIVLACYSRSGQLTFAIPELVRIVHERLPVEPEFWGTVQFWVFLALMVGFAVKVPLVPLHTWLPLAHVEAPTAGSVLLAGVLLKLGTYGFLRLCLPLTPEASQTIGVPLIGSLAVIGIIYGALCALAQDDIKKLVAYSSVSHLGFCMLGLFALNEVGVAGSLLQMVNHGLSTGALFLLVGMLYERYHTRKMADYGGLAARLKLLTCFAVFICLSSVGMPGLNGFVGEVLVLMSIFDFQGRSVNGAILGALAASGIVLGTWYLFTMLRQVFFGVLREPAHAGHEPAKDISPREWAALLPIAGLCLLLGMYPQPFLEAAKRDIRLVVELANKSSQAGSVSDGTGKGVSHR